MSKLVLKTAYLSICPRYRDSARIVCSDDTTSSLCFTQARLTAEMGHLAGAGHLSREEMLHLREEISSSGLPYRDNALEAAMEIAAHIQAVMSVESETDAPEEYSPADKPHTSVRRYTLDDNGQPQSLN